MWVQKQNCKRLWQKLQLGIYKQYSDSPRTPSWWLQNAQYPEVINEYGAPNTVRQRWQKINQIEIKEPFATCKCAASP